MQDFLSQLQRKHALSLAKYPPELWAELDPIQMLHALESEVDELKAALWRGEVEGLHGIEAECVDCCNVAMRIAIEMKRRAGMNFYVEMVKYGNPNEVVKRIGPMGERKAERVDDGININLDHDKYFTRVVPEK